MTRPKTIMLVACNVVWLGSAGRAQLAPIPKEARQSWYVDEAKDRCFMSHAVEGGANRRLTVQTYPGSQLYDLVLESDVWPVKEPKLTDSRLELKPVFGQHWYRTLIEPSRDEKGHALKLVGLPGSVLFNLTKATSVEVSNSQMEVSYPVPAGVAEAAKALTDCQVDKMIEWGADSSGFGKGALPVAVRGDPKEWFGFKFFDKPKSYRFAVRMLVSPEGTAESCDYLSSSFSITEQALACQSLMKNAKFKPARSPKGTPVRSVFVIYGNLDKWRVYNHLPED